MNVLHLHPGTDTAGQSMAAKAVLEAAGDSVRAYVHHQHPFGYGPPADLWDRDAVRESYRWADVVVVHNDPRVLDDLSDGLKRHVVVHHHGTRFRSDPKEIWEQGTDRGVDLQVVSTVDLLLSVPAGEHAEWMPQVVNIEKMEALGAACRPDPDSRIVVTHAPTNRMVKGTRWVTQSMRVLRKECDYILIQKKPWVVCLTLKASSHVFVDQLILGYGNNAVEAWGMGLPVISGASESILAKMREVYGQLPFREANPDTLTDAIRSMVKSRELREQWAATGRSHIDRFHVPDAWIERTRSLYEGRSAIAA